MSILYIVSTPIGNLNDITLRALQVLRGVDLILCEDTRITRKLLHRYKIKKPILSYHRHTKLEKVERIIQLLKQGKDLALVSDAGTPGVSDPGSKLISKILTDKVLTDKVLTDKVLTDKVLTDKVLTEYYNDRSDIIRTACVRVRTVRIVPVPGPSAVTAAVSVSDFPMDKFVFLGFPPAKKKRKKFFEEIIYSEYPVIFYESPYRIIKSLTEMEFALNQAKQSPGIVVCRELTKKFETIYRGTIREILGRLEKEEIKGEFTVIVSSQKQNS